MEGENVGFAEEILWGEIAAEPGGVGVGDGIVRKNPAAEAGEVFDDLPADGAGAKDADGLVAEFEAFQPLQFEVSVPNPLPGPGNFPGHREEKRESEFRNGVGRVGGDRGNGDTKLPGRIPVDVVGAGAERGHQPGAAFRQGLKAGAVDPIIHKDKRSPVATAQWSSGGVEGRFEELEMMQTGEIGVPEGGCKVRAGTKKQRFHVVRLQSNERESESGGRG